MTRNFVDTRYWKLSIGVLRSIGLGLLHGLRSSKKVVKYAQNVTSPLVLSILCQLMLVGVSIFRWFKNSEKTIVVVFFVKLVFKAQKRINMYSGELF